MHSMSVIRVVTLCSILALGACGGGGSGNRDGGVQALNTGLAIAGNYSTGIAAFGDTVLVLVNEVEQNGNDLNGDGDTGDDVMHAVDSLTGSVTNLGVSATPGIVSTTGHVAWGAREADEGLVDFTGDGDFGDTVLVIFNPNLPAGPGNPNVTGLQIEPAAGVRTDGSSFFFVSSEFQSAQDINGDGDFNDFALRMVDPVTLTVTVGTMSTR